MNLPDSGYVLLLVGLIALVFAAGCSSISVSTDFDKETDFSRYKTYAWHVASKDGVTDLLEKRIKDAVNHELAAKGFQEAAEADCDLVIEFYTDVRNEVQVYSDWYGSRWGGSTSVVKYKVGTLVLDFIDREQKQLVWRGSAEADIDGAKGGELVKETIQKVMASFPPTGE